MRSGVNWIRLKRAAEDLGEGLDRQGLGQARDALEEEVAAGQEADEHPLEHRVLADDDPPDLEQDRLRGRPGVGRVGQGAQVAARGVVGSSRTCGASPALGSRLGDSKASSP